MIETQEKSFGEWLKREIENLGKEQRVFAETSGIPFGTLRQWISAQRPNVRGVNLVRLAKALGRTRRELEEKLMEFEPPEPDQNIEIGSMQRFVEIPPFDRDLAAGHWTEAIFVEENEVTRAQLEQRLFRVRLSGDSMEKMYKNGSIVEFRMIDVCREGLIEGGDFYIQRDDEMATFKRIQTIEEERVILVAINRKKYPEPMMVARSQIVRCARAVGIFEPIQT